VQLVVGAAVLHRGRVLATRRTKPPEAAGRWEFPGGKVEDGESPDAALVREIAEELGCTVTVEEWLHPEVAIGEDLVLRVAVARLVEGDPEPSEHDAVRWLAPGELGSVDWLEPDRPFLGPLLAHLADAPGLRAVFFEQDDARTVADHLVREGWRAHVERERLAGEDDDEDHPWAVVTDAPLVTVELLVDAHDGWLDPGDEPPAVTPPELPDAPLRIKRPAN